MSIRAAAGVLSVTAVLACAALWPAPALAHAVSPTADVQLAQSFTDLELTVVIRQVAQTPGPLRVDLVAYRPAAATTVAIEVRSTAGGGASSGTVRIPEPGTFGTDLRVTEAGPHELALRVGDEVSVLPFRVLVPREAPWLTRTVGAISAAVLLGLGWLVTRGRPRLSGAFGAAAVAAVTIGLTIAVLSSQLGVPEPEGAAPEGSGRPYLQARWDVLPAVPAVGEPVVLGLSLVDGSTGRPADDLIPHHAGLVHAVVTSQDGGFFRHVHPRRTGPGRLEVAVRVDRPGRYRVYAEAERDSSGGQLATGEFVVDGDPAAPPAGPPAATPVTVTTTPSPPVAGVPATIEVATGQTDLQPWLGMAGHLILRDEAGGFLGHVHELTGMTGPEQDPPEPTDARYGPALRFTFMFPEPGRYLGWLQYARDLEILTVPVTFEVGEEAAA